MGTGCTTSLAHKGQGKGQLVLLSTTMRSGTLHKPKLSKGGTHWIRVESNRSRET